MSKHGGAEVIIMRSPVAIPLVVSIVACLMLLAHPARAEVETAPPAPTPGAASDAPASESPPAEDEQAGLSFGALAGVGFPRPLAFEGVMGLGRWGMVGLEYGVMPKMTFSSVEAKLWSAAADFRVFPFRGAFFLGLRGGYQNVTAATTLTASGVGSYTESVEMGTWFLNPRIGFLWKPKPFAIGIEAGVQVPVSTTVTRPGLLALVAPDVDSRITTVTDMLGRTPIPTVDLLRVGMIF